MEQSTLDYYEPIFLEVVKRNPDKFVEIMKPYVERENNSRWLKNCVKQLEQVPVRGTKAKSETIQWWLQQEEQTHDHTNIKRA